MKNKILVLLIFTLSISKLMAQLTDPASVGLSGTAAIVYGTAIPIETTHAPVLKNYVKEYNKRGKYYGGALYISEINDELEEAKQRLKDLEAENNTLYKVLYYSKRMKNDRLLESAQLRFEILEEELKTQETTTLLSEKMNLYENTMRTLTRINRSLDTIQSNINDSKYREKMIKMMKGI